MAAVLAKGTSVIENAAREPEITDLAQCLNAMGAKISGLRTDTLTIEGVDRLHGATYAVMPDRIEAGSYACAALITGGSLELVGARRESMPAILGGLHDAGALIEDTSKGIKVSANGGIKPLSLSTAPFPAFPTDMQAQFMAMLSLAEGTSLLTETIFENRYMHVPELNRMGADIEVRPLAVVRGVDRLVGAGDGDRPAGVDEPDPRRPRCRGRNPGPSWFTISIGLRAARGEAAGGRRQYRTRQRRLERRARIRNHARHSRFF